MFCGRLRGVFLFARFLDNRPNRRAPARCIPLPKRCTPLAQTSIDVVTAVRMPRPVAVKAGHAVPDKRKHRPIEVGIQRIPACRYRDSLQSSVTAGERNSSGAPARPAKKTAACPPSTSITVTTCRAAISTLRPLRGTIRYSRFTLLSTATIPASVRQARRFSPFHSPASPRRRGNPAASAASSARGMRRRAAVPFLCC